MSRDCPTASSGGDSGRTTSRSRSHPDQASNSSVNDDWGISSDPPPASGSSTTPRGATSSNSAADDWATEADAWVSGSKSTTPRPATAASTSSVGGGGGGDDWGAAADSWASGSTSKSRSASSSSKPGDWSSSNSNSDVGGRSSGPRSGGSGGSRACYKVRIIIFFLFQQKSNSICYLIIKSSVIKKGICQEIALILLPAVVVVELVSRFFLLNFSTKFVEHC